MSTPKLIDVTPFEPMIIKVHYDGFNFKKLEPVLEKLVKDSPLPASLEVDDAKSSVSNPMMPHMMDEFSDFYKWLEPIVDHIILNEWGLVKAYRYIYGNSWVNYHGKNGFTDEHHHGPATMVLATYLNLPENGGFIEFKDPLEYQKGVNLREIGEEHINWKKIPAKTGDVLMFPGWIRHRTERNMSTEKRWVLTTNINSFAPPKKNKYEHESSYRK